MAYHWNRKTQLRKSLTSLRWINPKAWKLSKQEIADALGIPVGRVIKATCLQHQVTVSWRNERGQVCRCFYSYRLFTRWQNAVLGLIRTWSDLQTWERLASVIEYELERFPYPEEMGNWIWENLKERECELRRAAQEAEIKAETY